MIYFLGFTLNPEPERTMYIYVFIYLCIYMFICLFFNELAKPRRGYDLHGDIYIFINVFNYLFSRVNP